jgi:tetratricopeptide (TPR) repeat protein
VKVKAGQSSIYVDWGNDLLQQEQFPAAIEKFEIALSKSDGANEDGADALANGQIQWAHQLSADEDFEGALEHFKSANKAAVSDAMKKSVEAAVQETYVAFSKSSGSQARRAMKEALKTVCEKHKTPDLPIFGLNKDSNGFGIYGVDDPMPESLNAKTPGEMHYVACVTADNRTIESRTHKKIVLQFSRGYFYVLEQQFRVQVIWKVSLLQTDTGKSVAEQTFTGEEPPPFSETGGNYFYGKTPIEELAIWLPSVLE